MNKAVLVACGSIAVLAGCGPALAADDNRVDIQAVVTETYDSNVAASDAGIAAERDVTPQDSIFAPSVAIDLLLPVSRQALFLKGSVGYDFYANNHDLSNGQVDLQGGIRGQVASCKGALTDDYNYAQSSLQDLPVAVTRNSESSETIGLNASCGGQVGFAPTLAVSQSWSDNSSSELVTSNFTDLSLQTGLAYRQPRFGELSGYFSYVQTNFPDRELLVGPASIQDGYKVYGVGVQYDRHFGARIEGTIKVAYTSLRPDAASVAGYNGVTFDADVTFRFSRLLQAKLMLDRSVDPTIRPDVTYALENSYGLEVDYALGRKLKLVGSATGSSDSYHGANLIPGVDIASETDWEVHGAVTYQLNRRIGFELDADHQVRDANIAAFSYADTRVGLSIKVAI
jgi:hypothetical protein